MKRHLLALCLLLSACGSGGGQAPTSPAIAPALDKVRYVSPLADGGALIVTERTEYRIEEYMSDPVRPGDTVQPWPYGCGTTIVLVNGVQVGNVIDWQATEEHIMHHYLASEPDPVPPPALTTATDEQV